MGDCDDDRRRGGRHYRSGERLDSNAPPTPNSGYAGERKDRRGDHEPSRRLGIEESVSVFPEPQANKPSADGARRVRVSGERIPYSPNLRKLIRPRTKCCQSNSREAMRLPAPRRRGAPTGKVEQSDPINLGGRSCCNYSAAWA